MRKSFSHKKKLRTECESEKHEIEYILPSNTPRKYTMDGKISMGRWWMLHRIFIFATSFLANTQLKIKSISSIAVSFTNLLSNSNRIQLFSRSLWISFCFDLFRFYQSFSLLFARFLRLTLCLDSVFSVCFLSPLAFILFARPNISNFIASNPLNGNE